MSEYSLKEQIRDLLSSYDFKKLTHKKDDVNIFKILNICEKEKIHSNFLAWLFSPYESHELNNIALKELLIQLSKKEAEYINLLLLDYSDLEVYREYTIDNGRRIDILMESKNNKVIFIIENKIWSGESDNQLEYYKNYIDEKYSDYNRIFLFLTPEKERKEKYKGYIHITYSMIYNILNCVLQENQIKFDISVIIRQYKEIIGRYIMGSIDKEMIDLCRKLYVERKEVLDKILQYGLPEYYYTYLISEILERDSIYECEIVRKYLDKHYIIIIPICSDDIRDKLICGANSDRDNYILTISIEPKKEYTDLYLQVTFPDINNNEIQQTNYKKIINAVERIGFKNKWRNNKGNWYNIMEERIINSQQAVNVELQKKIKSLTDKFNDIINCFNE